MPHCPSCHCFFRTERDVKNHLSHQFSSCADYLHQLLTEDNLLNMEDEVDIDIEAPPQLGFIQTELTETGTNYHMDPSMDNNVQHNTGNSPENAFISPMHIDSIEPQDFFTIKYPGASATYGRSSTFYEHILEKNQHVEGEEQSIFYPFSCLED